MMEWWRWWDGVGGGVDGMVVAVVPLVAVAFEVETAHVWDCEWIVIGRKRRRRGRRRRRIMRSMSRSAGYNFGCSRRRRHHYCHHVPSIMIKMGSRQR